MTQDLCAVCAVDVSVVDDALAHLGCTAEVPAVDPHTLDEVLASVATLGKATRTEPRAVELVASLRARLDEVVRRTADRPRPRVLVLEWTDPPFAPGHWVPEMAHLAGGEGVLGTAGEVGPGHLGRRARRRAGRGRLRSVRLRPRRLTVAGRGSRRVGQLPEHVAVWAVDANASFARPGPRLVDGVEALAGILHPDEVRRPPRSPPGCADPTRAADPNSARVQRKGLLWERSRGRGEPRGGSMAAIEGPAGLAGSPARVSPVPAIEAHALRGSYRDQVAVSSVDFTVDRGTRARAARPERGPGKTT